MERKLVELLYKYYKNNKTILKSIIYLNKLTNYLLFFYILYLILNKEFRLLSILLLIYFLSEFIIKKIIKRKRPIDFYKIEDLYEEHFIKKRKIKNYSFPSTHTLISMTIFFYFLFKKSILFELPLILIPLTRVLSLKHWLSDVVLSIFFSIFIILYL